MNPSDGRRKSPPMTAEFPVPRAELDALRARLAEKASSAGLADISYRTVDSPVGRLLLAATERGLVRIAFERQGFSDALEGLAAAVSARIVEHPARLDAAARELDEYFEGRRNDFALPLDHALSAGFRLAVQRLLPGIPYGGTATYAALATEAGSPRAVRAVGTACATNPLPIVVPCHRVLRSDGGLGGYAGGTDAKRLLLDLESAA